MWVLVETSSTDLTVASSGNACDHTFSNIKLIQSNIFDLRPILMKDRPPRNNFERKLSYFESDLFSDAALRELQGKDRAKDADVVILCTDFEATAEGYFVGTNKPFMLFFNKSPARDNIIKIPVEEAHSKFYPTIIEMCPSRENLLIGFSDGSVKLKSIMVEDEGAAGGGSEVKVTDEEVEENNLSAKSCAIQNIVKNERKLYHDSQALNNLDSSEMTKTYASPLNDLQRRELRVEGTVLGGSYFRKEFVRKIQMTRKHIFALCGDRLKAFHLKDRQEMEMELNHLKIVDIGSTTDGFLKSRLVRKKSLMMLFQ